VAIVNKRPGVAVAIVAGGVAVFFSLRGNPDTPQAAKPDHLTPVVAAALRKADEAIYRIGLGTVQAFNKVTIRSRVEGELEKLEKLEKLGVVEGQDVRRFLSF